jgi:hypothetical protein
LLSEKYRGLLLEVRPPFNLIIKETSINILPPYPALSPLAPLKMMNAQNSHPFHHLASILGLRQSNASESFSRFFKGEDDLKMFNGFL